jgi:molybdopterin converting factor small subunit
MVHVVLPGMLASQAGSREHLDVEAETLEEALRSLPVADLLFNERGELNRYVNIFIDGADARERGGLACSLSGAREVRIVASISGG